MVIKTVARLQHEHEALIRSEKGSIRDGVSAPTEISQHCQHARWERGRVPFRYPHDYQARSIIDIESPFSDEDLDKAGNLVKTILG